MGVLFYVSVKIMNENKKKIKRSRRRRGGGRGRRGRRRQEPEGRGAAEESVRVGPQAGGHSDAGGSVVLRVLCRQQVIISKHVLEKKRRKRKWKEEILLDELFQYNKACTSSFQRQYLPFFCYPCTCSCKVIRSFPLQPFAGN
jgi:hypothetical protein